MAISLVGVFSNGTINGTNVTLTPPTLLQNDVVYIGGGFTNTAVAPGVSGGGLTTLSDQVAGAYRAYLGRKVIGASPDTSFTGIGTGDGLDGQSYIGIALRGADPTTPEDVAIVAVVGSTSNPDPGAVVVATAGSWVLVLTAGNSIDIVGLTISGYTVTPGTVGNDNRDSTANLARKEAVSVGSENPPAWVGFTISDNVTYTIAVRPFIAAPIPAGLWAPYRAIERRL